MEERTKIAIKETLITFSRRTLCSRIPIEKLKRAYPFHAIFFTDEGLKAFKNQRSLVTSLGQKLIPDVALLIARDKYRKVYLNHPIEGKADKGMTSKIFEIVDALRRGERSPNPDQEWEEILRAESKELIEQSVIADLYIDDFIPVPLMIEIKSPKPNLDICAESKKKMLAFRIIRYSEGIKDAQAFFGLWYNPDIEKPLYSHSFTGRVFDMDREVLLGEEMWDKLGGEGTFEELLQILEEVKKELGHALA